VQLDTEATGVGRPVGTGLERLGERAALRQVGRLFPSNNRAPWIEPVAEFSLRRSAAQQLPDWAASRTQRVSSGFYTSQAMELSRP
jgi:magnesium-protoporphyrin O-methyltransferase